MNRKLILDIAERTVWSGLQAAAAVLIIEGFTIEALSIAGTAAGIAVCKCVLATRIGDDDSAAALPGKVD